jgi:holin-like protein
MFDGLIVILLCQLAGDLLAASLHVPVPGPVLGMLLLFGGLMIHGRTPASLVQISGVVQRHLSLLFIPAGAGLMELAGLLRTAWWSILIALIVSTTLGLMVTAYVMARLERMP